MKNLHSLLVAADGFWANTSHIFYGRLSVTTRGGAASGAPEFSLVNFHDMKRPT